MKSYQNVGFDITKKYAKTGLDQSSSVCKIPVVSLLLKGRHF